MEKTEKKWRSSLADQSKAEVEPFSGEEGERGEVEYGGGDEIVREEVSRSGGSTLGGRAGKGKGLKRKSAAQLTKDDVVRGGDQEVVICEKCRIGCRVESGGKRFRWRCPYKRCRRWYHLATAADVH